MITKRIIPCLDIKDGRAVKGIHFKQLKDAGDPVELAIRYAEEGADELVFLDIEAKAQKRTKTALLIREIARELYIPFTIGGGIESIKDVGALLNAGADKISVNTAAFQRPQLINELVGQFGSQCVILSIDAKHEKGQWWVYLNGGCLKTAIKASDWAKEAIDRGVGEILLTSMNQDGTKSGFALDITREFSKKFSVPIIASGGAGKMEDFYDVFQKGSADAALAASVFHYNEIEIPTLKEYLRQKGIAIRPALHL